MTRPVGYYVHHQGAGHWQRACLVARASQRPFTLIGTFDPGAAPPSGCGMLALADDRIGSNFHGEDGSSDRPSAFHYAPLGVPAIRQRMALLAAWCAENDPALLVVDVSVEIALFARLLSVPTAVVRLTGARVDPPHLEAFRAAERIIAPFPPIFESETMPKWVRDKTIYGGFLAARGGGVQTREPGRQVVVVLGRGGHRIDLADLVAAASATRSYSWHVYGGWDDDAALPANLTCHGWQSDIGPALDAADVVVGAAGDGLLAEVAVRAKRFVCIPEDRAFDEQREKGKRLAALGLALVFDEWPVAGLWPSVLRNAAALDPMRLHSHVDHDAVARLASEIETTAASCNRRSQASIRPSKA